MTFASSNSIQTAQDQWGLVRYLIYAKAGMCGLFLLCTLAIFWRIFRIRAHFYSFFIKVRKTQAIAKLSRIQQFYKRLFETQLFHYNEKIMELLKTDLKKKDDDTPEENSDDEEPANFNAEIEQYRQVVADAETANQETDSDQQPIGSFKVTAGHSIWFGIRNSKTFFLGAMMIALNLIFFLLIRSNLDSMDSLQNSMNTLAVRLPDITLIPAILRSSFAINDTQTPQMVETFLAFRETTIESFYNLLDITNSKKIPFLSTFYNDTASIMAADVSALLSGDTSFSSVAFFGDPKLPTYMNLLQNASTNFVNVSTPTYFVNQTSEILSKGLKTMFLSSVDYNDYLLKFYLNPGIPNSSTFVDGVNYLLYFILQYYWIELMGRFALTYINYYQTVYIMVACIAALYLCAVLFLLYHVVLLFAKGSQDELFYGQNVLNLIDDDIVEDNEELTNEMVPAYALKY